MDINDLRKKINKKTAAIVGIAGTTELGKIDPINEISDICQDENIFLHIDAAFGGFVIPFLNKENYPVTNFDFKNKGVSSISVDFHKMGNSIIPLGILSIRNRKWLEKISIETPYISSKTQAGLLATRSGGPVAAAYAVSKLLGKKGYKLMVKRCMTLTDYTKKQILETGLDLYSEPTLNVIAVKLKNLNKIVDDLTILGWKVNKMERLSSIRIVLMPQINKKDIDEFIHQLRIICKKNNEI
jgi:tyrosine decarboxylase/aspartate 1-decarboxylase